VTSVLQQLPLALHDRRFVHVVPQTTRAPRDGELPGRDYHFVSTEEFEHLLSQKLMVEAGQFNVSALIFCN
jgi:guanylate kinase